MIVAQVCALMSAVAYLAGYRLEFVIFAAASVAAALGGAP